MANTCKIISNSLIKWFFFFKSHGKILTVFLSCPVELVHPARHGDMYVIPSSEHTGSHVAAEHEQFWLHCENSICSSYEIWGVLIEEIKIRTGWEFSCFFYDTNYVQQVYILNSSGVYNNILQKYLIQHSLCSCIKKLKGFVRS